MGESSATILLSRTTSGVFGFLRFLFFFFLESFGQGATTCGVDIMSGDTRVSVDELLWEEMGTGSGAGEVMGGSAVFERVGEGGAATGGGSGSVCVLPAAVETSSRLSFRASAPTFPFPNSRTAMEGRCSPADLPPPSETPKPLRLIHSLRFPSLLVPFLLEY